MASNEDLLKRIEQLEERLKPVYDGPKDCFSCALFTMRDEKPHMRTCKCPEPIRKDPETGLCVHWLLEPDRKKRKRSFV